MFIVSHQASLAIFREHSKKELSMPGGQHSVNNCSHTAGDDQLCK